jgi:MFS family permease
MILGAALAGYLSERWGRRLVMISALMAYAISGGSGLLADTLPLLVGSRLVLGLAAGVMLTTSYAMMGEYFEGAARERMLGFGSALGSLSAIANLLIAGPLVDAFGWRAPFVLYLPALLIAPAALIGMHSGKANAASTKLSWRPVLALWPFLGLLTLYTVGMYMSVIQTPFLVAARGLGDATQIGFLVATTSFVAAICAFAYGFLRPLLGFHGLFGMISLGLAAGMLVSVSADSLAPFVLGCALLGLGAGLIEPAIASAVLTRTQEPLHDRAMGAVIMALFLGQFLNPIVLRPLRELGGIDLVFTFSGAAYLALGALFLLVALGRRPRTDQAGRRA